MKTSLALIGFLATAATGFSVVPNNGLSRPTTSLQLVPDEFVDSEIESNNVSDL